MRLICASGAIGRTGEESVLERALRLSGSLTLFTTLLVAAAASVAAQETQGYRIEFPPRSSLPDAGTFSSRLAEALGNQSVVHVDMNPPRYEVWVGDFAEREHASTAMRMLRTEGITGGKIVRSRIWVVPGSGAVSLPAASPSQAETTAVQSPRPATLTVAAGASGVLPRVETLHSRWSTPPTPVKVDPNVRAVASVRLPDEFSARPLTVPVELEVAQPRTATEEPTALVDPEAERESTPEFEPKVLAPDYRGFHGATSCTATNGWAFNPDRPEERVRVAFFAGDRRLGEAVADGYRKDLEDAGFGDGRYGFRFVYDREDDAPAVIEVRVEGSGVALRGTPKVNPCRAAEVEQPSAEVAPATGSRSAEPTLATETVAESVAEPLTSSSRKSMSARVIPTRSIRLDGRLDDDVWDDADFVADFEQKGLDRGFPRPPWTRVAFLYDEEALYIGARLEGPGSEDIDTRVARRDDGGNVDRLLVSLDTHGDRRTAYTFGVTAGGARLDHFHPDDREFPRDDRFDPVWEARTFADSTGWTAEMRIPFSQLRFNEDFSQAWGVNVRRWNPRALVNHYWVVVPMEEQGWASRFGDLQGLESLESSRRLELAPYLLRGVSRPTGPDADAADEVESTLRVGGDVKIGFGPDLTLDASVLPDFGQIEADPADVNLTAFETTLEERRPFFAEGAALLRGRGPRYFYSRRIGAVPHGTDPGNGADLPANTDILGAVKLTGRLSSGLSVGGLLAVTPRVTTLAGGPEGAASTVVAPASTYGAGRVERELGGAGSVVGLTLTGVYRALEAGSIPETVLGRQAVAGGGDWNLRFDDGTYQLSGHVGFSALMGDERALAWIQRSSVHYFQRPDASHVEFDPTRTSLSGYTGSLAITKVVGTRWTWALGGSTESPGFNIRDLGLLRSADHKDLFATVGYRKVSPGSVLRHYLLSFQADASWNHGGVRQYLSPSVSLSGALLNFVRPFLQVAYEAPVLSDELTRGGPLMGTPAALEVNAGLAAPFASRAQWSVNGAYRTDEFGGWRYDLNAGASLRAGSHVELSLYPGFSRSDRSRQYYGFLPDGPAATFGRHEIFSLLATSELYAQARVDVAVTPDISFQVYAEPFASSGDYYDYGELIEAGGSDLTVYGQDGSTVEPADYGSLLIRQGASTFTLWPTPFNIRSFRSNAVIRWEWRPGSSIFAIWQQNRWGYEGQGGTVRGSTLVDSLRDSGENLFTVKFDYRMGIR